MIEFYETTARSYLLAPVCASLVTFSKHQNQYMNLIPTNYLFTINKLASPRWKRIPRLLLMLRIIAKSFSSDYQHKLYEWKCRQYSSSSEFVFLRRCIDYGTINSECVSMSLYQNKHNQLVFIMSLKLFICFYPKWVYNHAMFFWSPYGRVRCPELTGCEHRHHRLWGFKFIDGFLF